MILEYGAATRSACVLLFHETFVGMPRIMLLHYDAGADISEFRPWGASNYRRC